MLPKAQRARHLNLRSPAHVPLWSEELGASRQKPAVGSRATIMACCGTAGAPALDFDGTRRTWQRHGRLASNQTTAKQCVRISASQEILLCCEAGQSSHRSSSEVLKMPACAPWPSSCGDAAGIVRSLLQRQCADYGTLSHQDTSHLDLAALA